MSDSKRWIKEHINDEYVIKAKKAGYPSRAAFKLLEIQEKDRIVKPGMLVVDLGAAPGGWSMVAKELIGRQGAVIAIDLLPMQPMAGVHFIQGDFNEQVIVDQLLEITTRVSKDKDSPSVDLVISDMAPNISGMRDVDQIRSLHLVELAYECAQQVLKPGGSFLAKIFQGVGVDALIKDLRSQFRHVRIRKPKASRPRSSEVYIVAVGYKKSRGNS